MTWTRALISTGVLLVAATVASPLHAAPAEAEAASTPTPASTPASTPESKPAEAKVSVSTRDKRPRRRQPPAGVVLDEKTGKVRDTRKWIYRYSPERHLFELGVFGGLFIAPSDHDLYDPDTRPAEPLWRASADVGARLAYFPLRFLGFEGEFAAIPTFVRNPRNDRAFVYSARGHAILQLPYRVAPFVLGGYGGLGVMSAANALGNDLDPTGHFGGGVKIYISRMAAFRVEGRGLVSAQATKLSPQFTTHAEILAGFSLVLGRVRPLPKPKDLDPDKDGFLDPDDKCPKLAGVAPDGCPAIDSDNDTFLDNVDKCPFEAGVAPDGCPPPDRDKDTFLDPVDACPDEPGIAPDGCPPPPDTDGDGIIDKLDKCPLEPENYNGYEDEDGCRDQLPEKARDYDNRPIPGIFFEFGKDKIQKKSHKNLDAAVAVFKEFPSLRIEISGHTDDVGTEEANLDLSRRRAEAVKQYLVDKGVEPSRIETVGYGRSKPIDPGKSAKARAKNRRIEFRILIVDKTGTATVMPNPANDKAAADEAAKDGATTPGGEPPK